MLVRMRTDAYEQLTITYQIHLTYQLRSTILVLPVHGII